MSFKQWMGACSSEQSPYGTKRYNMANSQQAAKMRSTMVGWSLLFLL